MNQSQLYGAYDRNPGPVVNFITYLRDLYGLQRHGLLLDMGCGPGRLLAPLSESGWKVTDSEPDSDYSATARAVIRGLPEARFSQGGFRDLEEDANYDLIASTNSRYCYVLNAAHRREALARCARALRPGGVLFLELLNFFWVLKNYREPPPLTVEIDGVTVTRTVQQDFDYDRGIMTHWTQYGWDGASGAKQSARKTHRTAMVSYSEIALFLEDAGFDDVHTFNSFNDRAPEQLAGGKIMVSARWHP
jgi:SAM-dependent methyltransferase